MTERWRCFVAVPMPEPLGSSLAASVAAWRAEPAAPDLRWTAPRSWHLTLAFLGPLEPAVVPSAVEVLRGVVVATGRWHAESATLGTFGGARRARVLWYGVADPDERLEGLARSVRDALAPLAPGLAGEEPFTGHVTLARSRDRRGVDLSGWLPSHAAPRGSIPIDRLVLYRSQAGRGPARYEALGSVELPRTPGERDASGVTVSARGRAGSGGTGRSGRTGGRARCSR